MEGLSRKGQIPDDLDMGQLAADRAMQGPILVAVNFSSEAEAALLWASRHAERLGVPLEVLHVVHDPAHAPGTYKPDNGDPLEPMADVANRKLAKLLERIERDNPDLQALSSATAACVPGLPARAILDMAKTRGAQLLVLGGRQRNGFARLLHGSTAHEVASHAEIPVTIVKADAP